MKQFNLSNGKLVVKPTSKLWLALLIVSLFVLGFTFMLVFVSDMLIVINLGELGSVLRRMFTYPDPLNTSITYTVGEKWGLYFGYMSELMVPLGETLSMSLAGTVIGSAFAFPFAILAAKNVFKTKFIYIPIRFVMNIIRTIPAIVLAILAVSAVGGGVLSGVIAITIFTFGIMAKMFYEVIETVDMGPFEALESSGANKLVAFKTAILPQVLPLFLSYLIYIFEINVRASTVLGYVGAGGIGTVINGNMLYHYERVGAAILLLFVVVLVLQIVGNYVRGKLQ